MENNCKVLMASIYGVTGFFVVAEDSEEALRKHLTGWFKLKATPYTAVRPVDFKWEWQGPNSNEVKLLVDIITSE